MTQVKSCFWTPYFQNKQIADWQMCRIYDNQIALDIFSTHYVALSCLRTPYSFQK